MENICVYCGLQLPDTTDFCPECGRPIERGFEIRPIRPPELGRLSKEMKAKEDLTQEKKVSMPKVMANEELLQVK